MGEDVVATVFSREDRQRYREKVKRCLDVFARMLSEARFDAARGSMGLEIELNLTDEAGDPALVNARVLEAIADADFQTELAQFNVEINVAPRSLSGRVFTELEQNVRTSLNNAEEKARSVGAHMVMVGILPTVTDRHLNAESFSANPRYQLLNEQIFAARGEDLDIAIAGFERLATFADTITPEAACTSVQLHLQVDPSAFGTHWNAAQAIAGVQLALGANSPFFFGKELWRETRIPLFEQATDTRPEELRAQGVRPRVWFGERWITSIFDLFEENVRYFPALLPVCEPEDPAETLERGDTPSLAELQPLWTRMSFSAAEENFHAGARDGLDARLYWPGIGDVPVGELVLRRLLPAADQGLQLAGIDAADRDRLLGVIERRCVTMQNGAAWQAAALHRLEAGRDRPAALREMTVLYREHMHA